MMPETARSHANVAAKPPKFWLPRRGINVPEASRDWQTQPMSHMPPKSQLRTLTAFYGPLSRCLTFALPAEKPFPLSALHFSSPQCISELPSSLHAVKRKCRVLPPPRINLTVVTVAYLYAHGSRASKICSSREVTMTLGVAAEMESIDVCQFFTGASREKGKKGLSLAQVGRRDPQSRSCWTGIVPLARLGLARKELGSQGTPVT